MKKSLLFFVAVTLSDMIEIVIDGIFEEVGVMEGFDLRPYPQENIVTTLYLGKPQKNKNKSLLRPYPSPHPLELNDSRNLFKKNFKIPNFFFFLMASALPSPLLLMALPFLIFFCCFPYNLHNIL